MRSKSMRQKTEAMPAVRDIKNDRRICKYYTYQ